MGSERFAFRGLVSPVYQDACIWVVKRSGVVVEERLEDEEDEVLVWNETKAKLRVATETHLRLMIKQWAPPHNKNAIPRL